VFVFIQGLLFTVSKSLELTLKSLSKEIPVMMVGSAVVCKVRSGSVLTGQY